MSVPTHLSIEDKLPFQDNVVRDNFQLSMSTGLRAAQHILYEDRDVNKGKRPLTGAIPSASR